METENRIKQFPQEWLCLPGSLNLIFSLMSTKRNRVKRYFSRCPHGDCAFAGFGGIDTNPQRKCHSLPSSLLEIPNVRQKGEIPTNKMQP